MQALKSGEAKLASALASRQSAEILYESEQRKFKAGTTTLFLVLVANRELLVTRSAELQAQTDLNKAISEFQRATGTTLSANNVTVTQKHDFDALPDKRNTAFGGGFFKK
jgi:outer membrane protein TolC